MTSESGHQINIIHILLSISRIKGIQTMKYGQLIKYFIKMFFLKNLTQNVVAKLVLDPFIKNQN